MTFQSYRLGFLGSQINEVLQKFGETSGDPSLALTQVIVTSNPSVNAYSLEDGRIILRENYRILLE